jgi:bis(5'-nucleosidyl)-tetraphosphatase
MLSERSAGAIIFSIKEEAHHSTEYLLLHYSAGHWDFPKGNIEDGEKESEAAYREIYEETGIESIEFFEEFRRRLEYYYRREQKLVHKEVIFFLAKTNTRNIILSSEHVGYMWSEYNNALEKLTYKNAKNLLVEAQKFLNTKYYF